MRFNGVSFRGRERSQRVTRVYSNANYSGITVLGGGVVGLMSAMRLKEAYNDVDVRLVAEHVGVNTTSAGRSLRLL